MVWRIDRLGRSLIDVLNTVNTTRDAVIGVLSISDGLATRHHGRRRRKRGDVGIDSCDYRVTAPQMGFLREPYNQSN